MFDIIKTRIIQGNQAIKDVRRAEVDKAFRGLPEISGQQEHCGKDCQRCRELCPTRAIELNPVQIDLGKCIFCGDCQSGCPRHVIGFTHFHKLAATEPGSLRVTSADTVEVFYRRAIQKRESLRKMFRRSLKLRQVSAAGCNGCELELNACSNVNFDMQRFGIEFVASPRHADGVVITGPISENMAAALEDTYLAIPEPRIVIAVGTCAISGGVFASSPALNRSFLQKYPVDLYVPGCPVHPLTFINGLLDLLD